MVESPGWGYGQRDPRKLDRKSGSDHGVVDVILWIKSKGGVGAKTRSARRFQYLIILLQNNFLSTYPQLAFWKLQKRKIHE